MFLIWYFWKATAECNITLENILLKRRIKIEKNENENFQLFV